MTHRQIEPWAPLGPDPRIGGVRLLLVGESHYDEGQAWTTDQVRWFTNDVVYAWAAYSGSTSKPFFARAYAVVTGRSVTEAIAEYHHFWRSVFFYNFVQTLVEGGPGCRPSAAQFEKSGPAFLETLEDIRPDAVLVLGKAVWDNMSTDQGRKVEGRFGGSDVWQYRLADGSEVPMIFVPHPASRGFNAGELHDDVRAFLNWCRANRP